MSLTSTEIVNQIFADIIPSLDTFIQGDLLTLISAFISILFILFAFAHIRHLMTMTSVEKDARSAFRQFKDHRGEFDEPLFRDKYQDSLRKYDDSRKDPYEVKGFAKI